MYRLLSRQNNEDEKNISNIQIHYNIQFPLNDILSVLHPIFGQYYPFSEFFYMLYTINHIFGAYDKTQGQCIACALLNNDGQQGGLYLMLFGVKQLNQSHGVGTYLLENIIQWARQSGYRYIYLHVHVDNHKAIGLYDKLGFYKQEYVSNFYSNIPKYPPHAIRMILLL